VTYPYPPPQQPEPRRSWFARHKILTVAGVLLLLCIVISVASTGGGEKTASGAPAMTAPSTPATAAPTETPTAAGYGSGDYVVGEDIPAGTYTTDGATQDSFEFCMISTEGDGGDNWGQLKSANANERIIITLNASDGVVTLDGCEPLRRR
jgi:hypothetical protein